MRKAKLVSFTNHAQGKTCHVTKKDFDIKSVQVKFRSGADALIDTGLVVKNNYGEWCFKVSGEEWSKGIEVVVIDRAGNTVNLFN